MKIETYNGYTNYETWNYCLHLDNNQESQQAVIQLAKDLKANSETPYIDLADTLKEELENNMPEIEVSVYSDLLWSAMEAIDWAQVARHYIDEVA